MAKKQRRQWQQFVRAEVAAALQQSQAETAVTVPAAKTEKIEVKPPSPPGQTAAFAPAIRHDLIQITWLAGGLISLIVLAAVTDQANHWLDRLASAVSQPTGQEATDQSPTGQGPESDLTAQPQE